MRVVGAGLGRTGTHSLKLALEQLLGEPCYHMMEVFGHPEHLPLWRSAIDGEQADWDGIFAGYRAAVDWPTAAFWRELADVFPEAVVLLSTRPADEWWRSADRTILEVMRRAKADERTEEGSSPGFADMVTALFRDRFTERYLDPSAAMAAYEAHNAEVRATVPPERLVDWMPGDGWDPICAALEVPVPEATFPHVNTTDEFRAMAGFG